MKPIIIMPAYNEALVIQETVASVRSALPEVDIAVVDDGSSDGTGALALAAGAVVLPLPVNLGYGGALQTGFVYARDHGYDVAIQLDADGQHEPESARALLRELQQSGADVVIGSRFLGDGDYRPSAPRAMGMALLRFLIRATTGQRITDPTSGYQALGRRALDLYASDAYPHDYPDADVLIMVSRAGLRVREIPVTMYQRDAGESMHSGLRPVWYLFKMLLSITVTMLRQPPRTQEVG